MCFYTQSMQNGRYTETTCRFIYTIKLFLWQCTAEMPFCSCFKLFFKHYVAVSINLHESVFKNAGPTETEIHISFPITSEKVDFKSKYNCLDRILTAEHH